VSRYRGNADTCKGCGLRYGDLRTGLTFREVAFMIKGRPWRRRRSVLGFWHQIKRQEWAHHREHCEPQEGRYAGGWDP
jgi:hypothetical protein